jgi:hypothetical protein
MQQVECIGEVRIGYTLQVRKSEGKRPLGRLRPTSKHNIQMDLKEIRGGRSRQD